MQCNCVSHSTIIVEHISIVASDQKPKHKACETTFLLNTTFPYLEQKLSKCAEMCLLPSENRGQQN